MSAISEILLNLGCSVSGSDISEGANTIKLREKGVKVSIGHSANNIVDPDLVVFSSAISEQNVELVATKEKCIPCYKRSEILSDIMRLKNGIAIAGTHGKTTTTSLVSTIFTEMEQDPTYLIGGIVKNLGGHARVGKGPWFIAEADESDGTFLKLSPILSAVTNVDFDHLDFYKTKDVLIDAFKRFCNSVPFYGEISLNINDANLLKIGHELKKTVKWFGIRKSEEQEIDIEARNIRHDINGSNFELFVKNEFKTTVKTSLIGDHNIENILAAISIASGANISFENSAKSIERFLGVGRRMQLLVEGEGFKVIDDYAHHPTELRATIGAVEKIKGSEKVVGIFEPHRFSRTKECWKDFVHSFSLLDKIYLLPIYPASEEPIEGINSTNLASEINSLYPGLALTVESINEVSELDRKHDCTILTMGAGSIGKKIRDYLEESKS